MEIAVVLLWYLQEGEKYNQSNRSYHKENDEDTSIEGFKHTHMIVNGEDFADHQEGNQSH